PNVVMDFLKVPKPFAGARVQGNNAVGKEIVAAVIHANHIVLRRTRRDVSNAADFIQCHSAPTVRAISSRFIPGSLTELARARHCMKRPEQLPGKQIKPPNVPLEAGHDDNMLEYCRARSGDAG